MQIQAHLLAKCRHNWHICWQSVGILVLILAYLVTKLIYISSQNLVILTRVLIKVRQTGTSRVEAKSSLHDTWQKFAILVHPLMQHSHTWTPLRRFSPTGISVGKTYSYWYAIWQRFGITHLLAKLRRNWYICWELKSLLYRILLQI